MTKAFRGLALCTFFVLCASVFVAAPVRADDYDDDDEETSASERYAAEAVQNRMYGSVNELSMHVGLLPMDAFTKGLTLGGAYTLHFSHLFAWEVVNGFYSFHLNTSLKDDLGAFDLAPTPFEVANYALTTNLVFKPVYWKGAWLNDSVIHGEILGVIGGGYAEFTRSQRIAIDAGIGFRVFFTSVFAVRLDVRYMGFLNTSIFQGLNIDHEIWTTLGMSVSL